MTVLERPAPGATAGLDDAPPERAFQRLHPGTMAVDAVERIGRTAWILVVAFLFGSVQDTGIAASDKVAYLAAALGFFGVGGSVYRYLTIRYAVTEDRVCVRSGILSTRDRAVPIDRIQSIELTRSLLERWIGLASLKIDNAASGMAELRLSCLGLAHATELRAEINRRRSADPDAQDAALDTAPETLPVYTASLPDLVAYGATDNRVGVAIGAVSGAYVTFKDQILDYGGQWFDLAADVDATLALLIVLAFAAFCMGAGWLLSILHSVVTYYGFRLYWEDDELRRGYGLLTKVDKSVPMRRIQVVRIEAPLLRRLLGRCSVFEETAGDFAAGASGEPLCPYLARSRTDEITRLVFPHFRWSALVWQRPSPRVVLQALPASALVVAAAAAGLFWWQGWPGWLTLPIGLAVVLLHAVWSYRVAACAADADFVVIRAGALRRRIWIVPKPRVQAVFVSRSWVQRRLGLANLSIDTAGAFSLSPPKIRGLPLAAALALQNSLSRAAHEAGDWTPDGL